ncbi:MAG: hypothetical protein WC723_02065 [Candidatus Omnitrophota bacterium]
MPRKARIYGLMKLWGMLSFIPLLLVSAPLLGYAAGKLLIDKFRFPPFVQFVSIGLGFMAAILETVSIIKAASKIKIE